MLYISDSFDIGLVADAERNSFKISLIRINDPKTIAPLVSKTIKLGSFKSLIKTKKNASVMSKALGLGIDARPKEDKEKITFTILDQFYCASIDQETGDVSWFTISRLT